MPDRKNKQVKRAYKTPSGEVIAVLESRESLTFPDWAHEEAYERGEAPAETYGESWWTKRTPWKEELGETFLGELGERTQSPFPVMEEKWAIPTLISMGLPFAGWGMAAGGLPTAAEAWGLTRALPQAGQWAARVALAPIRGVEEAMALPFKGVGGIFTSIADKLSKKQATRLLAGQIARNEKLSPELVEKVTPKVAKALKKATALPTPFGEKVKGALDYALTVQKRTARLYRQQRAIKAGKLKEIFAEMEGVESYKNALRTLKKTLEKAEFDIPAEFKLTEEEIKGMLNSIYMKNLNSYDTLDASTAVMKLGGLIRDEKGLPAQLQKHEIQWLDELFPELESVISAHKVLGSKTWARFVDAINIPRAFQASGDFTVTFRQLILGLGRKPQYLPRVLKAQIKTVFNPLNWRAANEAGLANPDVQLFMRGGMFRAPEPGTVVKQLWKREEQFQSNLAEKIPYIGAFIRASDRAFTAGANAFRDATARDYAQMLRRGGILYTDSVELGSKAPQELLDIARKMGIKNIEELTEGRLIDRIIEQSDLNIEGLAQIINWSTGRGTFPNQLRNTAPLMNALFFSPRFVLSRVYDTPRLLFHSNPIVRKEAWRTVLQCLGLGASVMGAAKLAGADITWNPINSDVAKIKVGNTRIDIWAGYAQYVRFLAQLILGKREITGTKREQEVNRLQIAWRLLQSKGSPIFSIIVDLLAGETYMGEPMFEGGKETIIRELKNRLTPLVAQDILDALEASGLIGGMIVAPASFLGIGATSYKPKEGGLLPPRQQHLPSLPEKGRGILPPKKVKLD